MISRKNKECVWHKVSFAIWYQFRLQGEMKNYFDIFELPMNFQNWVQNDICLWNLMLNLACAFRISGGGDGSYSYKYE